MAKIGVFFGTTTGRTRKIAKFIKKKFDDELMAKPVNINRASDEDFLSYDFLILGTSTMGRGQLPGRAADCDDESWQETIERLDKTDFTGKTIAIYGLGDQDVYGANFCDGLRHLHDFFAERGATLVGRWPTDGYDFEKSKAVVDGAFLGLVLDEDNQWLQSSDRLDAWLKIIGPSFGLPAA